MAATIQLDIVSLESSIFSDQVEMVIVSGIMGELGIMPGHTPMLTAIKPGQIRIILPGNIQDVYYISGGILEIQPYIVTILADTVVRADDLDEVEAATSRKNAEVLLSNKQSNIEFSILLAQLAKATAKLRTIQLAHNQEK